MTSYTKLKVVDSKTTPKTTVFRDLEVLDFFELNGYTYIKISDGYSALSNGRPIEGTGICLMNRKAIRFPQEAQVIPINNVTITLET